MELSQCDNTLKWTVRMPVFNELFNHFKPEIFYCLFVIFWYCVKSCELYFIYWVLLFLLILTLLKKCQHSLAEINDEIFVDFSRKLAKLVVIIQYIIDCKRVIIIFVSYTRAFGWTLRYRLSAKCALISVNF